MPRSSGWRGSERPSIPTACCSPRTFPPTRSTDQTGSKMMRQGLLSCALAAVAVVAVPAAATAAATPSRTPSRVFDVELGWVPSAPARGITIDTGVLVPPSQLFGKCPIVGVTFPALLTDTSAQRQIVARIPATDLFNRAFGKHIVLGSGRFVSKT